MTNFLASFKVAYTARQISVLEPQMF